MHFGSLKSLRTQFSGTGVELGPGPGQDLVIALLCMHDSPLSLMFSQYTLIPHPSTPCISKHPCLLPYTLAPARLHIPQCLCLYLHTHSHTHTTTTKPTSTHLHILYTPLTSTPELHAHVISMATLSLLLHTESAIMQDLAEEGVLLLKWAPSCQLDYKLKQTDWRHTPYKYMYSLHYKLIFYCM